MSDLTISVNEGTIILVAQILKTERNLDQLPLNDAVSAIRAAMKALAEEARK